MTTPSAFELGRSIGGNVSGGVRQAVETDLLGKILNQAKTATSPQQQLDLMGTVLQRVSPERRPEVMDFLKQRYQLAQQQGELNEFQGRGSLQQRPQASQQLQPGQEEIKSTETITTPQGTERASNILLGTPEALQDRARQLIQEMPITYRANPQKALEKATSDYNNQQNMLQTASKEFIDSLQTFTEKAGNETYKDIIGEMQDEYLRNLQEDVVAGKGSPQQLASKSAKSLLDFAKTRANVANSSTPSLFGISAKDAQSKLQATRQNYKERNRLDLFEDDLVNKVGLSTPVASLVAFPLSENREIASYAKETRNKNYPVKNSRIASYFSGIGSKSTGNKRRTEEEIGEYVSKNLKDTDSLNAIAASFNAKGYNPQKILDVIQQKKWKSLNERQKRDLEKRTTFGATLKDIAYFTGTGLNPMEFIDG